MKLSLKIGVRVLFLLVLVGCTSAPKETLPVFTQQVDTSTPTLTREPTLTPTFTETPAPIPTATFTPWPTKEVLAQFGVFGGDGGWDYYAFIGGDMPKWVLYTDGQLITQKQDSSGVWFEETTLTVPQMCSFLSRLEEVGFFNLKFDDSSENEIGIPTANPIFNFDDSTEFSEGGSTYILQVNGPNPRQIRVYYSYVQYLIPEAKKVFNFFNNYSSPSQLTAYQPQYLLLKIEKGLGDLADATPAPTIQTWSPDLPSLEELATENIETAVSEFDSQVSQVLIKNEQIQPVLKGFGNRLAYKEFQSGDQVYYVVARPFLPHETLNDFSGFPKEKAYDLPFSCSN